ncbi:MAG: hypothetical protein K9L88_05090 [Chromatiaceae bacterium]|nr:hypothetical protein [Chromatiaceae bacterium]
MKPAILFVALLFAVILIQLFNRPSADPDADLAARLALLEARTALLTERLAQLEQEVQLTPSADQPAAATAVAAVTSKDSAVDWRLGAGLQGDSLRVAAQTFDQRRGRVEVLLEIKAPLADADAWPRQPGLQVPVIMIARDNSGAVAAEQPLTLMRGPSQEPGAYLHLGAELSEQTADRVQVIELRRSR